MNNLTFLTEVCAGSVRSAVAAAQGGAQRVELCENLTEGGTTPSLGSIKVCAAISNLKTMVMIRPRGGDFLYSDQEFQIMMHDIEVAREAGAHGVVFGILTHDGRIDQSRMTKLIELARGLDITCHRAFDMTRDPIEALNMLIDMGIKRVLTSGMQARAVLGKALITKLVHHARGRVSIMPGSGVNEETISQLLDTGATEFHIAPKTTVESEMVFRNPHVNMGLPTIREYEMTIIDSSRVNKVVDILNNFKKPLS